MLIKRTTHDSVNPKWRKVADEKWTMTGPRLDQLDFNNWWVDNSSNQYYLHVKEKESDCYHRIFCKRCKKPRIGMAKGELYWIY